MTKHNDTSSKNNQADNAPSKDSAPKGERIAKVIARAGLCSRRDAERWIEAGRVQLDGKLLESPAVVVGPEANILVDGKPLPEPERPRLWRYHKPKGQITSARDPEGRPTVFDNLPKDLPRLQPIGRLDFNSEGLLLFTNDGEIKRKLELPATGWKRRYRVRVHGQVEPRHLDALAKGVTVEGVRYGPIEATLEHQAKTNAWLLMSLREGKNREIRRVCEHLGLVVNRLLRISYGPFQLGDLEPGAIEELPAKLVRDQLGLGSAGQADSKGTAKPAAKKAPLQKSGGKAPRKDAKAKSGKGPGTFGKGPASKGPSSKDPHGKGPHSSGKPGGKVANRSKGPAKRGRS